MMLLEKSVGERGADLNDVVGEECRGERGRLFQSNE